MKTTTSRPRSRVLIATAAFSAVAASLAALCAAADNKRLSATVRDPQSHA